MQIVIFRKLFYFFKDNIELISVLFIYIFYSWLYFSIYNYAKWDFPGHMYQGISSITDLESSIYNFKYLLGFHAILYPPLISTIQTIFNYTHTLVVTAYITQGLFVYITYKTFKYKAVNSIFYIIFLFIFLTTSIGLSNLNLLYAGTIGAYIGYLIFAVYIYLLYKYEINERNYTVYGLLLGISFLTHSITSTVLLLLIGISILVFLYKIKFQEIIILLKILLIGGIIGLIWIVPYLYLNNNLPRSSIMGYFDIQTIVIVLLLLALIFVVSTSRKLNQTEIIITILTSVLLILSIFQYNLVNLGLHFSRYLYYAFIAGFPIAFSYTIHKYTKIIFIIFFILFCGLLLERDYKINQYFSTRMNVTNIPTIDGRLIDISSKSDTDEYLHYFYSHFVSNNINGVSNDGLYIENAPNGFLASGLRVNLNKDSWFPLFNVDYKEVFKYSDFENIEEKLDLFGITNVLFTDKYLSVPLDNLYKEESITDNSSDTELKETEDDEKLGIQEDPTLDSDLYDEVATITNIKYGFESKIFHKQLNTKTRIVTPLGYLPKYVEPDDYNFPEIWTDLSIENIVTNDPKIKKYNDKDFSGQIFSEDTISDIEVSNNTLKFMVNTDTEIPVYIKFAYSPFLVAYSDEKYTEIIKVAPDFMLLLTKGSVTIKPYTPPIFSVSRILSIFGLVVVVIYTIFSYRSSKYKINFEGAKYIIYIGILLLIIFLIYSELF